ncbi:hypothetical protein D4764_03G0013480 [Takifugu flavidus]|uniref:Uncharacterized protein n=1 Tax=Takifugu flavidus TaxID=433684 RepID=A0A5C6NEE5_9TELE|nr:hypothetical protein D4764_03G0013480 [Takifugu flavidus]
MFLVWLNDPTVTKRNSLHTGKDPSMSWSELDLAGLQYSNLTGPLQPDPMGLDSHSLPQSKVLRGLAPSYLEELVIPYQPNRPLRSQNAGLLVVPRVSRSRMGGRAFSYQAPLLWNQLPVQFQLLL